MHIQSELNLIYKQNLYHDKQRKIDEIIYEYHLPLLKYIDYLALIEDWKINLDTTSYEKINKEIQLLSKKKEIDRHCSIAF